MVDHKDGMPASLRRLCHFLKSSIDEVQNGKELEIEEDIDLGEDDNGTDASTNSTRGSNEKLSSDGNGGGKSRTNLLLSPSSLVQGYDENNPRFRGRSVSSSLALVGSPKTQNITSRCRSGSNSGPADLPNSSPLRIKGDVSASSDNLSGSAGSVNHSEGAGLLGKFFGGWKRPSRNNAETGSVKSTSNTNLSGLDRQSTSTTDQGQTTSVTSAATLSGSRSLLPTDSVNGLLNTSNSSNPDDTQTDQHTTTKTQVMAGYGSSSGSLRRMSRTGDARVSIIAWSANSSQLQSSQHQSSPRTSLLSSESNQQQQQQQSLPQKPQNLHVQQSYVQPPMYMSPQSSIAANIDTNLATKSERTEIDPTIPKAFVTQPSNVNVEITENGDGKDAIKIETELQQQQKPVELLNIPSTSGLAAPRESQAGGANTRASVFTTGGTRSSGSLTTAEKVVGSFLFLRFLVPGMLLKRRYLFFQIASTKV
jgi:hypothetical protein